MEFSERISGIIHVEGGSMKTAGKGRPVCYRGRSSEYPHKKIDPVTVAKTGLQRLLLLRDLKLLKHKMKKKKKMSHLVN